LAWREGCAAAGDGDAAIQCRRDGLVAALRYRLTSGYQRAEAGDGAYDGFAGAVAQGWLRRWPAGVEIPDPNLLDYDPLAEAGFARGGVAGFASAPVVTGERMLQLAATMATDFRNLDERYEPLYERPPLEIWKVARPLAGMRPVEPRWMGRVVAGLGDFLAAADIERLDARLAAMPASKRDMAADCVVGEETGAAGGLTVVFRCDEPAGAGLVLNGRLRAASDGGAEGTVSRVRADSAAPGGLVLEQATLARDGDGWVARFGLRDAVTALNARIDDGSRIDSVTLTWPETADEDKVAGLATLTIADDFTHLIDAVDALAGESRAGRSDALGEAPFRRVAVLEPLFAKLGIAPMRWCCVDDSALPPPVALAE